MDPTKLRTPLLLSFASLLLLLLLLQSNSATLNGTGFTIELIHRDSVRSPLYPGNLTDAERIQRLAQSSQYRARSLASSLIGPRGDMIIRPTVSHEGLTYMVAVGIGSMPETTVHLMLDTGSNTIWTQIDPCGPCFPQDGLRYKPSVSGTFSPLPSGHYLCGVYRNDQCIFSIRYGDGTHTSGFVGLEYFTFESATSRSVVTVRSLIFGCSNESSSKMFTSTKIGGIVGMGRGPDSLPTQLASFSDNRFSLCIGTVMSSETSYLRFGSDIVMKGSAQTTPLVGNKRLFYVNLIDIRVNGQQLNLPPETFVLRSDGTGGCIVDTGCTGTHLIRPAYYAVKKVLIDYFARRNVAVTSGSGLFLDLCFVWSRWFTEYPSMDLILQDAIFHLPVTNLFVVDKASQRFCLAMMPIFGVTVIGATQQQNHQFVYDVGKETLSFAAGSCADS